MNQQELDTLYEANISELNKLSTAAGSMVKTLLQALQQNGGLYLRLSNPIAGGHSITYSLVEGDQQVVDALADALGLTLNGSTIEVPK